MLVVWLVLALVLLVVESRHLAFYALFGAAGALAAAVVAAIVPSMIPVQVAAAVVVGAAGIWLVRPLVSERFHRRGEVRLGRGVHGSLIGEEVLTLDEVGDEHHVGHVRLAGERWLAVSEFEQTIPVGTRVRVADVRGTTLIVCPTDPSALPFDPLYGIDPAPDTPRSEER